jgi:TetR/AcrR family transcriptional regulator, transcriptional repressor for nem operon
VAGIKQFDEGAALDALVTTFWARGYQNSSIEDLERATGLKRQSLYNAFGPKEAMYRQALARYGATIGAPIRAAMDREDPLAGIKAFLDAHLARMEDESCPAGCLHTSACIEHGGTGTTLSKDVEQAVLASESALLDVLKRWQSEEKLRQDRDPQVLARFLVAFVRGLAVLHKATGDAAAVRDASTAGLETVGNWLPPQAR